MTITANMLYAALGALFAALGVGLAAVAAHADGQGPLSTAALFFMVQGPALIAAAAARQAGLAHRIISRVALLAVSMGVFLFAGDLGLRGAAIGRLFPMAAPAGGFLMIGGWALFAASTLVRPRS
jgi:uncharacterized membrane protein YgdD (TMEM256/DUF423 family)